MKKVFLLLIFTVSVWSFNLLMPTLANAAANVSAGTLIKGTTSPTIYYVAEDGKRYVFPSANVFFSWFDDFKQVVTVSDEALASYPLGGNVLYRPGVFLVKLQTDPKVYLVDGNGTLRWVKSEAIAKALYGKNWNKLIDDLPDSFFVNYQVGNAVNSDNEITLAELMAQYPSISQNLGLRVKANVINRLIDRTEKQCSNLETAVNKLQKKLSRMQMTLPSLGDDFMAQCVEKNILTPLAMKLGNDKVTLCHKSGTTITVGAPAVRAHLAHGDSLGACPGAGPTDTLAPVISTISYTAGCTTTNIGWTTNEPATSKVYYSLNPIASSTNVSAKVNNSLVTGHSLGLTGLSSSTQYYFQVESRDAAGNRATSTELYFTTLASCADQTPPVISLINSTTGSTTATIAWNTNEAASSKVYYSLNPLASSIGVITVTNSSLVTSHSLGLVGLTASSTYYFKVESMDLAGNTATSTEATFITSSL